MGEYNLLLLNCKSLKVLTELVDNIKCLNKNQYLGNNNNIIIYKKQSQCNPKNKCNWNDGNDEDKKKCENNSDKNKCLNDKNCYYEHNSKKCLPKGVCEVNGDNPHEESNPASLNFTYTTKRGTG